MERTRVSAYGLVTKPGRILLCRLSAQVPRWQGRWTLPGGGLDFGEPPDVAMVREVQEETGLSVKPLSVETVHSYYHEFPEVKFHGLWVIYRTRLLGGTLRNEVDGSTDRCQWWDLDALQSLRLSEMAEVGLNYL